MCGCVAFAEDGGSRKIEEIKNMVVSGKRPDIALIPDDVEDYAKSLMTQCWAQRPADRPAFSGNVTNLCVSQVKKYASLRC